ncbi:MAG: transcriptional repressor [Pirellulaceae bacterium]|nr:transcriptional repressor [Pirellulaceae bacterium]
MAKRPKLNRRPDTPIEQELGSVEVALTPPERFEEYLQSKGKRNTPQRRYMVTHVFNQHEHFDADTLIDQLPRKNEPNYISRPTVYRTLAELVESGLLRKFELEGRAVYEHDYGYPQHDHLHCEKCGELFEFHNEDIAELCQNIAQKNNFRMQSHRLLISGICSKCNQPRQRRRSRLDRI